MCKLLIVDENLIEHAIADKLIMQYGYDAEVIHASNALSVIRSLTKNKLNIHELPDLIFLDLKFSIYSGWRFLKNFDKLNLTLTKKIQIYIVTSAINHNYIRRSKKYSFIKSYILKPLTKSILDTIFNDFNLGERLVLQ